MTTSAPRPPVVVSRVDLASPTAQALIAALDVELSGRYPEPGATHFRLDPQEVAPGSGAFLVAHVDGEPLGCGAIRRLADGSAELKRMYVAPAARGRGIGRALLDALTREARALGIVRLVLETGVRQPEAVALYTRAGFVPIAPFGEYVDQPADPGLSVFMGKTL
jgi:GNAT superfamily N-acetyltransferase